jgi:hypothetical protein
LFKKSAPLIQEPKDVGNDKGETVGFLKSGRPKLRQERQKSSFRPPLRGLNGFTSLPTVSPWAISARCSAAKNIF